eukprot:gene28970-38009_t
MGVAPTVTRVKGNRRPLLSHSIQSSLTESLFGRRGEAILTSGGYPNPDSNNESQKYRVTLPPVALPYNWYHRR